MLDKKNRENLLSCAAPHHGTTVPPSTVVLSGTAWPCQFTGRLPSRLSLVHDRAPYCMPVPCSVFLCFVISWCSGLPRTSTLSPESARNATFSNKTRRFFLKAQKSCTIRKTASKEANTSLSHLD